MSSLLLHRASRPLGSIFRRTSNKLSLLTSIKSSFGSVSIENDIESYYQKNTHYDDTWGDRLHVGYFPHIENGDEPELSWDDAGVLLSEKMGEWAFMNKNSKVLDFGCGYGSPAVDIARKFGCQVHGIDLTPANIERANILASENPDLNLKFFCGSFLDLPEEITAHSYTHVFSQLAICHVGESFDKVVQNVSRVLVKGGYFVNCDFLVNESGVNKQIFDHFYKRLKFSHLVSPAEYVSVLTKHHFHVTDYVNLNEHAAYGYRYVQGQAAKHNIYTSDGTSLATHYENTSCLFTSGHIAMPVIIGQKK